MTLLHKIAGTIENIRNNISTNIDFNSSAKSKTGYDNNKIDLELDICCDLNTLRYLNSEPESEAGYNKRSFLVEGHIYRKGTFDCFGYGSGIKSGGTPEFLDRLIGKWTCKGWYINRGPETKTGNYIDSTHTYEIDSQTALSRILTSNGKEKIDMNEPFSRVLCSGLGSFSRVKGGNVTQTNVGINETGAYNYIFKFKFRY